MLLQLVLCIILHQLLQQNSKTLLWQIINVQLQLELVVVHNKKQDIYKIHM